MEDLQATFQRIAKEEMKAARILYIQPKENAILKRIRVLKQQCICYLFCRGQSTRDSWTQNGHSPCLVFTEDSSESGVRTLISYFRTTKSVRGIKLLGNVNFQRNQGIYKQKLFGVRTIIQVSELKKPGLRAPDGSLGISLRNILVLNCISTTLSNKCI